MLRSQPDDRLEVVRSGGQLGVDLAGLDAALHVGFKTGGAMPYGFKNHDGYHPEFVEKYGMYDTEDVGYRERTYLNVKESDATLRIATNFESSGEMCTLHALLKHKKPYCDVYPCLSINSPVFGQLVEATVRWIIKHKVRVLNVAGNSERTSPGIYKWALPFLVIVFTQIKER